MEWNGMVIYVYNDVRNGVQPTKYKDGKPSCKWISYKI
jgi:hypothetical protein